MGRKARLKRERKARKQKEALEHFLLPGFLQSIRSAILRSGARADSCICSTKIGMQIARSMGLKAEPLSVTAYVMNPTFGNWIIEHDTLEIPDETMIELGEKGGRFLVVGDRRPIEEEGKWAGHLILLVRERNGSMPHAVDLSIDQGNRPHKQIRITQPLSFPVERRGFLTGASLAVGQPPEAPGVVFVYQAFPDDRTFEDSPDWRREYELSLDGRALSPRQVRKLLDPANAQIDGVLPPR